MIRSLKCTGARRTWPAQLPVWDRTLLFEPGLNLVVGLNGSGKTTLLRILGVFTGLAGMKQQGLPDLGFGVPEEETADADADTPLEIGHLQQVLFRRLCSNKAGSGDELHRLMRRDPFSLGLDWDRAPTLLVESNDTFRTPAHFGATGFGVEHEIQDMAERGSMSAGQSVMHRLERLVPLLTDLPYTYFDPGALRGFDGVWRRRAVSWNVWMDDLPKAQWGQVPTLILDEPDLSLAPAAQYDFWQRLATYVQRTGIQVIAATHSPFALARGHVVETTRDFAADVRQSIGQLAAVFQG